MGRLALRLGLIAVLNLIVAFLIQWWTLIAIGPGNQTDALYAALAVPQVLLIVVTGSLTPVLVPLFAGQPRESMHRDAWGFFLLVGGVFLIVSAVLSVSAGLWVPLLFPGFDAVLHRLTVELARIQLVGMFFSTLSAVLIAAYRAHHRFLWPELAQLGVLVLALGVMVWALPKFGIRSAAWIFSLRAVLLVLLLAPVLGRFMVPDWGNAVFRSAWRRIKPLLAGTTYYKSGPLVDRYLSSFVPPGGLSILYFGQQILDGAHNVVNKALTTPLLTRLVDAAQAQAWREFRRLYLRQAAFVTVLMMSGIAILLTAGKLLLHLLVGHGAVTADNVELLWWLLVCMGGFLIGGGLGQTLSVAFYAVGETRIPTLIGVIGFSVGLLLKVVLFFRWGLSGIALGLTVHHLLNGLAFLICVERMVRAKIGGASQSHD